MPASIMPFPRLPALLAAIAILAAGAAHALASVSFTFQYRSTTAKKAAVMGTFNDWVASMTPMTYDGKDTWRATISVEPGYYLYKFEVDGRAILDPANAWKLTNGDGFDSVLKIGNPGVPRRLQSPDPFPRERLPEPVLDGRPDLVRLYYAAWAMAWNKLQHGTPGSGLAPAYMDEGFCDLMFQWDSCFLALFGLYGRGPFPPMAALDNFYGRQSPDGYIQRVYWKATGKLVQQPTADEPMVNPPLFAWVEWRYYELTGDKSRFPRVLPVLERYFAWCEAHCRTAQTRGLFYITGFGSGMDNTPRKDVGKGPWIDYSAQQALAALEISRMAALIGDKPAHWTYSRKYDELKQRINGRLWDGKAGFYFDGKAAGGLSPTMHVGAFWTLLADVCPRDRLPDMIGHLTNPREFWRPHLIPALAATDPAYQPRGRYWLGGVWAPTDYMLVRGLMENGETTLADKIAASEIDDISAIYSHFNPDPEKLYFDQRFADGYHTIWECYSPETDEPATRWDGVLYSRQDFVGWSGLAPIALLIENVLGLDISGKDNTVTWRITRTDRHGLRNFMLGTQKVTLLFDPGHASISTRCEAPFHLRVLRSGRERDFDVPPGSSAFALASPP